MNKTIYRYGGLEIPYQRPAGREIFVIADTHFGHGNIIGYTNRPFKSLEEMDKTLIENWNSVVSRHDKVLVLGDFALTEKDRVIEIGQQLNGMKVLVKGNHDRLSNDTYTAAGFNSVVDYPIMVDEFFICSHEPQYVQNNGVYANIFGHIHNNPMYKTVSSRSACVSCEHINYTPLPLSVAVEAMRLTK